MKNEYHSSFVRLWSIVAITAGMLLFACPQPNLYQERSEKAETVSPPDETGFNVVKTSCPRDKDCLIFATANDGAFTCDKMKKLGQRLRNEYSSYKHVRVLIFDDPAVASEHLRSIRAPRDIDTDVRAVFEYEPKKSVAHIEFAITKGRRFDEVRINVDK